MTLILYNSEMGLKGFLSLVNHTDNGIQVELSLTLFVNKTMFGEKSNNSNSD